MSKSTTQLFIKYEPSLDGVMDLKELGKSLEGFHMSLEQIVKSSSIQGKVSIKATKIEKGSIIIDLIIEVINTSIIVFRTAQDLIDYATVVGDAFKKNIIDLAGKVDDLHRKINDYAAENPVDYDVIKVLGWYIVNALLIAKFQKVVTLNAGGKKVPSKIAQKLHKIVKRNYFKKTFKPFIEGEVSKIQVSTDKEFQNKTEITEETFGEYLSEDQKILPDWQNDTRKKLTGKITAMQSTRGDSMTFQVNGLPRKHKNLVSYPPDDKTTEDFKDYYKEDVTIEAEILRRSDYQKPKLIIHQIWITQSELKNQ